MSRLPMLLFLGLAACAPPQMTDAFHQVRLEVDADPADASERFADFVDKARHSVHAALPEGSDPTAAQALLDAWSAGREVEVVTDVDRAGDPGIAMLLDAGVPVTLADDGLTYFDFNINSDIAFASDVTHMTHAYAVVDARRALVFDRLGSLGTGETVAFSLQGEDVVEDLLAEHNQLFGGTDATSTTAFDGMAKSITDYRWRYATQGDLDLELWLGPQERLIKRVIDAIYTARGSVHVLTNDLTDAGVAAALQDKAASGFLVRAVVGPAFIDNALLSRPFAFETPSVAKYRYTASDDVPTVVLVDYREGIDGNRYRTRAFVLTHDLYSASRLDGAQGGGFGDALVGGVTDQLIDGALWGLVDYDEPSEEIETLFELWERHAFAAEVL